jgi:hypothetical protein
MIVAMGRRFQLVIALASTTAGCRQVLGIEDLVFAGDGPTDAASDADTDAAPSTCWPAWHAGTFALSPPRKLDEINTANDDRDPYLAADGLTLYFSSGPNNSTEIMVATRPQRGAAFGGAVVVPGINAAGNDARLSLPGAGAIGVLSSSRAGGEGGADLYEVAHGATGFGTPTAAGLAAVNTAANDLDPDLTDDGLSLYFALITGGTQRIYVTTRSAIGSAFGAPAPIPSLDVGISTADPTLSPDRRSMIVAALPGSGMMADLYHAARADVDDAFGAAARLASINSPQADGDAARSDDGCELFFASNRTGAASYDLFVTDVIPQ